MLWELEKPFSIEEVEVAPPKAHEVRIKVKYFLHVYLILGLKISESNSEDNQNSLRFLHGHPDSGITFVIKEICKYTLLKFLKETKEYILYNPNKIK